MNYKLVTNRKSSEIQYNLVSVQGHAEYRGQGRSAQVAKTLA
jgi:hypothetical protein